MHTLLQVFFFFSRLLFIVPRTFRMSLATLSCITIGARSFVFLSKFPLWSDMTPFSNWAMNNEVRDFKAYYNMKIWFRHIIICFITVIIIIKAQKLNGFQMTKAIGSSWNVPELFETRTQFHRRTFPLPILLAEREKLGSNQVSQKIQYSFHSLFSFHMKTWSSLH